MLGGKSVAMVQIVLNIENMYLYLTHESKDAIEKKKHKYDKADIKHINNFDIDRYVTLDAERKDDILDEVCNIIADHRLTNILELKNFVMAKGSEYGLPTMKVINSVLRSHTGLIRLYFDGVYQERKYGNLVPSVDYETREVLSEGRIKKQTFRGRLFGRTIAKPSDCHFEKMTLGTYRSCAIFQKIPPCDSRGFL